MSRKLRMSTHLGQRNSDQTRRYTEDIAAAVHFVYLYPDYTLYSKYKYSLYNS